MWELVHFLIVKKNTHGVKLIFVVSSTSFPILRTVTSFPILFSPSYTQYGSGISCHEDNIQPRSEAAYLLFTVWLLSLGTWKIYSETHKLSTDDAFPVWCSSLEWNPSPFRFKIPPLGTNRCLFSANLTTCNLHSHISKGAICAGGKVSEWVSEHVVSYSKSISKQTRSIKAMLWKRQGAKQVVCEWVCNECEWVCNYSSRL